MEHEQIRSLCLVAKNLAADMEDDELRPFAFSAILSTLLERSRQDKYVSPTHPARPSGFAPSQKKGPRKAGLKSRLVELVEQNYFHAARTVSDIASKLKIAGWIHEPKEISARLIDLVREKKLRRSETSSGMQYSNW